MHAQELLFLHALRCLPPVGDKTLRALVAHFGSAEAAWQASHFSDIPGVGKTAVEALLQKESLVEKEAAWELLQKEGIRILHEEDPLYPTLLREIPDHPLILYVRGNYEWALTRPLIAIVGSRKFTPYGEQIAEQLAGDLARAGCVVVSGLAFGIDKAAHVGTLENNGETLAVLASGIDNAGITPRTHAALGKRILENGALISEFPPGTVPIPAYFLMRNRIIAGLTQGTIVVEAAEHSGSLVTASLALDYNREVFAVPGSIFSPSSQGTNALIRRGAKLVTSAQDILEELSLVSETNSLPSPSEKSLPNGLSPAEEILLQALRHEPVHINQLLKLTTLSTSEIQSSLSLLELKGLAKNIGSMQYRRT